MKDESRRRVVITGMGVVAPNGIGKEPFWGATRAGRTGITCFEAQERGRYGQLQVAGIVRDFVEEVYLERKQVKRMDRMTHFALAAIGEAVIDAQLEMGREDPWRVGAVLANTMGGVGYVLKQLETLYTRGPRFMSAFTATAWLHVANVGQTAIRYGMQGYCKTPVNDTVGGLEALGMGYRAIQRGVADVIVAGGCEAFLHPFILLVLAQQGRYSTSNDPQGYRPFDRRATGMIVAEGAGMCVLEEYEHALARGARIYGEIIGYGQTNDANGLQTPSIEGRRYGKALCQAADEGQIEMEEIAYISLDGHALPDADQGEVDGLRLAFGPEYQDIPGSVPRTLIGHSYAAAGAIDTITALLALRTGMIPATLHCEELETRYQLDLVRGVPREIGRTADGKRKDVVLLGGRGAGGTNIVLAVKKDGER